MPETTMSRRAWRLDQTTAFAAATGSDQRNEPPRPKNEPAALESLVTNPSTTAHAGWTTHLTRTLAGWLGARPRPLRSKRIAFEEIIHRFAALIDQSDDPATVEAELLRLVRRMSPSSRIELVAEAESDDHDEGSAQGAATPPGTADENHPRILEIPLRCGASICGRLRIRPRAGAPSSHSGEDIRRLTTLGTMAACAMEGLGLFTDWPEENRARDGEDSPVVSPSKSPLAPPAAADPRHAALELQDATFLNAVLPFALSQSRRHREPLSIACVAIDRLGAIKQLLGKAEADRLVCHVAQIVGELIRSSDIVARLDDDRVVAVLPRAPRRGAMHVAENISRAVQASHPADLAFPPLTVSIGVATFPSCADNVYSLFDAADEALARAQKSGRGQALLAPPRPLAPCQMPGAQDAV